MKVIVMTGATSGIGAEAMKHLTKQPDTLIIVGARGSGRIVPKGTEVIPLDLSSLKSVRSFAGDVKRRLGNTPIDILILNAGEKRLAESHYLIEKKRKKSSEIYLDLGFESLSHFSFAFKKLYGYAPTQLLSNSARI